MPKITIKRVPFSELENDPDFPVLCAENAAESSIEGMPKINVNLDMYRLMDTNGLITTFLAYDGDRLIGYLLVLATIFPHYSIKTAMSESFFVRPGDRKYGAGLKLLRVGESFAKEAGSPGFFISAPFGGVLAKILPRLGYRETNQIFYKRGK